MLLLGQKIESSKDRSGVQRSKDKNDFKKQQQHANWYHSKTVVPTRGDCCLLQKTCTKVWRHFCRHGGRGFAAHVGVRDAVKPPRGRGTAPPQQRMIQPKTSTMQRWRNSALKLTYHCNTRLIKYCSKQGEDRGDA